ncbi:hypothetical protein [Sulfurimonas sp. NWX79]|uniref:hypothetical protein n=1 Tax=Sulfurimonas sp. NWX79 TaxID=2925412 RepID=UPI00320492B5
MTQILNPLLKPENRERLIQEAMLEIDKQQDVMIKKADSIIENVAEFEENVRKQFTVYSKKYIQEISNIN